MRQFLLLTLGFLFLYSCRTHDAPLVPQAYIDSFFTHYAPAAIRVSDSNLAFWERRMNALPDDFVNGPEYAAALNARFRLSGDIKDLLKADSLYFRSCQANQQKEAGLYRTLASLAMTRHQFLAADSFLKRAVAIEGSSQANLFMDFDVCFELGKYNRAKALLPSLRFGNSFGYLFRRSKMEHYGGSLDTAITCMLQAASKAGNNKFMAQVALSNAGDLLIHAGRLREAAAAYQHSLAIDAGDLHSLLGLGWIALNKDRNDSLAARIFAFIRKHSYSPDALLKLEQAAEATGDSSLETAYAKEYVSRVTDSAYGSMYTKYLIDLYTGILHQPGKALLLAQKEKDVRPTPQVMAWYCWTLYCDRRQAEAYRIYRAFVSGKPLEGPELFYMGKMMQGLKKNYNAQQFFTAAYKNRYDLSPGARAELEANLN